MVVDRLGAFGIKVAAGSAALRAELHDKGLINLGPGKLTDVTLAGARYETMLAVLDAFVSSGEFSLVISVVGSSAQFRPELAVQPIIDVDKTRTPVAAFMVPEATEALCSLGAAGITGFRTAESCADAVRALLENRPPRPMAAATAVAVSKEVLADPLAELPPGAQNAIDSLSIMRALGVNTLETTVIELGQPIPEGLVYPVVAKVLSDEVPHKTDAGGVILGIADADALAGAVNHIGASVSKIYPEAEIKGVVVQPMIHGLAEALIGLTRDPEVGPVVTLRLVVCWRRSTVIVPFDWRPSTGKARWR
jgi:acyl-CoA synthetase (NDP forming)